MQINKAILVPLLAAIAAFAKDSFGYTVPSEYIDTAANVILFVVTMVGLFMQPRKAKEVEVQTNAEHPDLSDAH